MSSSFERFPCLTTSLLWIYLFELTFFPFRFSSLLLYKGDEEESKLFYRYITLFISTILTCKVKKRRRRRVAARLPFDGWCRNVTDIIITELTSLGWFFRFLLLRSLDTICNIWHSIYGGYSTIVERGYTQMMTRRTDWRLLRLCCVSLLWR